MILGVYYLALVNYLRFTSRIADQPGFPEEIGDQNSRK